MLLQPSDAPRSCCSLPRAGLSQQSGRQAAVDAECSAQAAAVLRNASSECLQPKHPLQFLSSSGSTGRSQLGSDEQLGRLSALNPGSCLLTACGSETFIKEDSPRQDGFPSLLPSQHSMSQLLQGGIVFKFLLALYFPVSCRRAVL